jgi:hypothetical protein
MIESSIRGLSSSVLLAVLVVPVLVVVVAVAGMHRTWPTKIV